MAKQVRNTDVVQKDLFGDSRESAESLLKVLNDLEDQFKKLGQDAKKAVSEIDFNSKKDVVELEKATSELSEATEALAKVQKEKVKIDQQLSKEEKAIIKIREDQAKSTEENRVELQKLRLEQAEQRKQARLLAQDALKLTSEYQKQSRRLNELRKSQKDLILTGQESTKQFQDQQEEINKLDEALKEADARVGQFQRNVGNYEKASEAANKATERLQKSIDRLRGGAIALGGVVGGAGLLGRGIRSTQEGSDSLRIATEAVDRASQALAASIATGVNESISRFASNGSLLTKVLTGLGGAITGAAEGIPTFLQTLEQQAALTRAAIDFERSLNDQIQAGGEIRKGLTRTLQENTIAFERNLALSDQDTRNLIDRVRFLGDAEKAAEKAFDTERRIANERLKLAERELKLAGENNLLIVQAEQKLTQARSELDQIESNRELQRIDLAERRGRILQDQFELDLDLLIDFTDRVKTVNERLIDDENLSNQTRRAILQETRNIVEEAIEDQVEAFNEIENAQRRIDKATLEGTKVSETSLDQREQLNLTVDDFNRLLNLNAENLSEEAKRLGLSEIAQNRLREAIIETLAARSDLDEVNRELLQSEENLRDASQGFVRISETIDVRQTPESLRKELTDQLNEEIREGTISSTLEIERRRAEIEEQARDRAIRNNKIIAGDREALEKELIESFERVRDLQIQLETETDAAVRESIKARISDEINDREVLLDRIRQSNEAEIDLNNQLTEKAIDNLEKREKAQQEFAESAVVAIDVVNQAFETASQNRISEIDREIQAVQDREQALREAAQNGSELAEDNLAFNQRQQAELEQQREEQVRRAQRREIVLAGIKAFAENAGQPNAVGQTLSQITQLSAGLLNLIPGFYEGTEDTGKVGQPLDSNGGRLAVLHDNERVMTKEQNKLMGGVSNDVAAQIVHDHLNPTYFDATPMVYTQRFESNEAILQKFDELKREVANIPRNMPQVVSESFDEKSKVYTTVVKTANKVEKNHKRVGSIWG